MTASSDSSRLTFSNAFDMHFVLIPAGRFEMGRPILPSDYSASEIQHSVTLSRPFYMQTTPVTQAQWEAVMGNNPSKFTGDPHLPVDSVSWRATQSFLQTLNQRSEPTENPYRLPSEAEWEFACRAGSRSKFFFGEDPAELVDYAWFEKNAGKRTHPVAEKLPNPWNLYDLYGNVWEWVQDRYADYPVLDVTDPTGPEKGSQRVLRGGCYLIGDYRCHSVARGLNSQAKAKPAYGFRLAMTAPSV